MAVVTVDFRNAVVPSSVPEVAPFPAGLNDCVSGLKWVIANAAHLSIDPDRVIVAGESGGGNLTLATGLKLMCTPTGHGRLRHRGLQHRLPGDQPGHRPRPRRLLQGLALSA